MATPTSLKDALLQRVVALQSDGLGRQALCRDADACEVSAPWVRVAGKTYLSFLSNDSLGQATSPEWQAIVADCCARYPVSGMASRLAGGYSSLTAEAEQACAVYFGFDECLFLPSGYQANLAVIRTLLHADQHVFMDRRIHASMANALLTSKAACHAYGHADLDHLSRRLHSFQPYPVQPVVLTESLFSMDGTLTDMSRLGAVRQEHGAFVFVDEAHTLGLWGADGRGLCAAYPDTADMVLGTMGKALGMWGAFVLMRQGFRTIFEHLASPVMHSTALSPAHAAASLRLFARLPSLMKEREQLAERSEQFRNLLTKQGVSWRGAGHIIAVPLGDEARTARVGDLLRAQGILALAARYPTVPRGQGLLRFAMSALHTPAMVQHAVQCIGQVLAVECLDRADRAD